MIRCLRLLYATNVAISFHIVITLLLVLGALLATVVV